MIRVLIADDHPVVREGLKRILADSSDVEVVGEAQDGDDLLRQIRGATCDVLVMDVSMPGPGCLETLAAVRAQRPKLPILMLSMHPEDQYAVRTLRAGASGYLTKDRSATQLAEAVRRVHGGRTYVSEALAERLVLDLRPETSGAPHHALSDREFQVLLRICDGKANKEIGAELALSPKTVSTYRSRVLEKIGVKSTAELVRYAVEHGLV